MVDGEMSKFTSQLHFDNVIVKQEIKDMVPKL